MTPFYSTDLLEQRLKEKRIEWTNYPDRRARIEAEVNVLKVGISVINSKNKNNAHVFDEEPEITVVEAQEALL